MRMLVYVVFLLCLSIWLVWRINSKKSQLVRYILPIQNNTIFYYLLIALAILISAYLFHYINLISVIACYLILFTAHEIQWYAFYTQLFKDELESTATFYGWCNYFNDAITNISATIDDGYDFSEGIFHGDFGISNRQAMQNKYDLYYDYLKLKPGMKVLDIGCGNGHWGYYLMQRGIQVTGIVISKDNYEACKNKGLKVILG